MVNDANAESTDEEWNRQIAEVFQSASEPFWCSKGARFVLVEQTVLFPRPKLSGIFEFCLIFRFDPAAKQRKQMQHFGQPKKRWTTMACSVKGKRNEKEGRSQRREESFEFERLGRGLALSTDIEWDAAPLHRT